MSDINGKKKIYVACTAKSTTGGPESLHQLVSELNNIGKEAYIYYFDADKGKNKIHNKFIKYNIKSVTEIEDNDQNILVVSEYCTYILYKYQKVKKYIWWLSVDFYFESLIKGQVEAIARRNKIPNVAKRMLYPYVILKNKSIKNNFKFRNDKNKIFHIYNCEYARQFLIEKGIRSNNMAYLCGPIRSEYFENINLENKEDMLVYNPAKGYEFTCKILKKLKERDCNIKIRAIKGMRPNEIVEVLSKAKVYIDFGFFPGPERIPREAVSRYCNIITSKKGSAINNIDVPISNDFKFEDTEENIDLIVDKIIELIKKYEYYINEYDYYREYVKKQKDNFKDNIEKIFC